MFDFFTNIYYGNSVSQWAIALSLIVISAIMGRMIYWVSKNWLGYLTRKTETKLDDIILDMIEEPFVLAIVLIGIRLSVKTLTLTEQAVITFDYIFQFLFIITIAWVITRLYDSIHNEYLTPLVSQTDTDLDDLLLPMIKTGLKFVVWTVGIVMALNNIGYDVGAIIASLGIGGLAFALAAQDTVSNVFGGITIFIQRPFKIGDRIDVGEVRGCVETMGLRSTTITNFYGEKIFIPNKMFTDSIIKNIDTQTSYVEFLNFPLRHDTTAAQIKEAMDIIKNVAASNKLLKDTIWVRFDNISNYSFNIEFWFEVKLWQPEDAPAIDSAYHKIGVAKTQLQLEILEQFEALNIKLAVPPIFLTPTTK